MRNLLLITLTCAGLLQANTALAADTPTVAACQVLADAQGYKADTRGGSFSVNDSVSLAYPSAPGSDEYISVICIFAEGTEQPLVTDHYLSAIGKPDQKLNIDAANALLADYYASIKTAEPGKAEVSPTEVSKSGVRDCELGVLRPQSDDGPVTAVALKYIDGQRAMLLQVTTDNTLDYNVTQIDGQDMPFEYFFIAEEKLTPGMAGRWVQASNADFGVGLTEDFFDVLLAGQQLRFGNAKGDKSATFPLDTLAAALDEIDGCIPVD